MTNNKKQIRSWCLFALAACCFLSTTMEAQETRAQLVRPVMRGKHAGVATGTALGIEAATRLLHRGGTAIDAGVAATFVAATVEFSAFSFGGEAAVLVRTRQGEVMSIAAVGTAPKLATADFYRARQPDAEMTAVQPGPGAAPGRIPSFGILSAVVPGMVDGMLLALRDYGTRSFAEVIEPALELAGGYPMDERRSAAIGLYRSILERWPDSAAVFLPGGQVPKPGEIFRQPGLVHTLRGMVEAERAALKAGKNRADAIDAAREYFYRGPVAKELDRFSRANGGLIRYEDMATFHADEDAPVRADYRGFQVYKGGFWTQGPVMVEELNMLEPLDLRKMGHNSADYIHTMVETLKLAYADRDTFYGDPKFVKIPALTLLSRAYAAERLKLMDPAVASMEARPGSPDGWHANHPSIYPTLAADTRVKSGDTTCINVVDASGAMISVTPSGGWLPSVIAGSTGIPLTSRLQSFLLIPGHPNELQPGKRPRITLTPTLVLRDGQPYLALSTPGGDNQDQSLLQVLLNVIEFGMNPEEAVEAPRFQTLQLVSSFDNHVFGRGLLTLDERISESTRQTLQQRGHKVNLVPPSNSGAAPVAIRYLPGGVIEAGADPYIYRYAVAW
jgi:gamma-glutamyltranspeptidase/glutathione hydrolase